MPFKRSYAKKRTYRRKATYKKKAASKRPSRALTSKVKQVIRNTAELKYSDSQNVAAAYFNAFQLVAYDTTIIAQGVGQGQRVGMQANIKSIRLSIIISGKDIYDHNVRLLFLKTPAGLPLTQQAVYKNITGDFMVDPRQENTGITVMKQATVSTRTGQLGGNQAIKRTLIWNIPMKGVTLDYTNDANGRSRGDFQYWFCFISDQTTSASGADALQIQTASRVTFTDA